MIWKLRAVSLLGSSAIAAIALSSGAAAQTASPQVEPQQSATSEGGAPEGAAPVARDQQDPASTAQEADEEIVVTGTLLRGIAPVGTNVVGLDQEQIEATGATNTNDVLAKIPQISNFFNQVVNTGLGNGPAVSARPDIRNLSTFGGGNSTLPLVDGQRVAGVGVIYTSPDPDVVPPGALERVEVVADGGSSIYGSDAVGGVINLITRKRFQGLEVTGRAGFADDYSQYDGTVTAGTQWSTGGLYASLTYSEHDSLFGRDRDYIRNITPGTSCTPATLSVASGGVTTTYALPGLVPGTTNQCDTSDNTAIVPSERRYSALAGFNQQLSDNIDFNIRGYYTDRRTDFDKDELRSTVSVSPFNPNYIAALGGTQSVSFSYGPVSGPHAQARTELKQWGIMPSLNVNLGSSWELRLTGNYSESDVKNVQDAINATAQTSAANGTTAATALNPYNITATNTAVLASILNWEEYSRGRQNVLAGRGVLDGTLFSWGGGDVRLAVGVEYLREEIDSIFGNQVPGSDTADLPRSGGHRDVKSAFGEILVPVFGENNRIPGFYSLLISGSGRYDHYSDFGGTFNPKIGLDWKPFSALRLRGNYGTSFNAPSLADTNAVDQRIQTEVASIFNIFLLRPGDPLIPNIFRPVFIVAGGNPDLEPQTAKTYSLGFDFDAPFVPGLRISGTYWNIDFKDQISLPVNCLFNANAPVCSRFVIPNPTQAQVNEIAPGFPVTGAFSSLDAAYANPFLQPYSLLDARRVNIGRVKTDGIDFNASYFHATSFGSVNANLGGTYNLNRESEFLGEVNNDLEFGVSRLNLSAGVGAQIGNFGAQAALYHSAGFHTAPSGTAPGEYVEAFDVVNLFFTYDTNGEGLAKDLRFTMNVNNVFNTHPPFVNSGNGYTNGSTLGRLFQFGVSKRF